MTGKFMGGLVAIWRGLSSVMTPLLPPSFLTAQQLANDTEVVSDLPSLERLNYCLNSSQLVCSKVNIAPKSWWFPLDVFPLVVHCLNCFWYETSIKVFHKTFMFYSLIISPGSSERWHLHIWRGRVNFSKWKAPFSRPAEWKGKSVWKRGD